MPGVYVVNMQHYLDEHGLPVYWVKPVRPHIVYYGRIASAGSVRPVGPVLQTAVRCRRRPGRKPCPGYLLLLRHPDDMLQWECPQCGEAGLISGWRDTVWDRSRYAAGIHPGEETGPPLEMNLTDEEYRAVYDAIATGPEVLTLLDAAAWTGRHVRVAGSLHAFELLAEEVATGAHHDVSPTRRRRLQRLLGRIEDVLHEAELWS